MESLPFWHLYCKNKNMRTENNISISIPKKCHEDWNKMTPNQQGAHCKVCCKTVIDFTNKTDEELKNYFLKRTNESICGRFNENQITTTFANTENTIPKISNISFRKRLIFLAHIVFGSTLFSCTNQNVPVQGKVIVNDSGKNKSIENDNILMGDTIITTKKDVVKDSLKRQMNKPNQDAHSTKSPVVITKKDSLNDTSETKTMGKLKIFRDHDQ